MNNRFVYISLFISIILFIFSCQSNHLEFNKDNNSIEILKDGRLRVPILLHIPEREVVETKTTPIMTDAEKAVKTVDVCVFNASGNILEKVVGEKDPTNPLCVFAKVLPHDVPCKVQVYVNIPAECRNDFNAAQTLEDVQALTMSNVIFESTDNGLPMVSDLDPYTVLNSTTLKDKVAKLKFAYARIDVTNQATGFTLSSCRGLNFRQNWTCQLLLDKKLSFYP